MTTCYICGLWYPRKMVYWLPPTESPVMDAQAAMKEVAKPLVAHPICEDCSNYINKRRAGFERRAIPYT